MVFSGKAESEGKQRNYSQPIKTGSVKPKEGDDLPIYSYGTEKDRDGIGSVTKLRDR